MITVVASAALDDSAKFTLSGGFPLNAKEIIIHQLSYSSQAIAANRTVFAIHSAELGYIGSVVNSESFGASPQTHIRLRNPLPSSITFQIMLPEFNAPPSVASGTPPTAGDTISITLEFIV